MKIKKFNQINENYTEKQISNAKKNIKKYKREIKNNLSEINDIISKLNNANIDDESIVSSAFSYSIIKDVLNNCVKRINKNKKH